MQTDHILVAASGLDHFLFFNSLADGLNLIAQTGSLLVAHLLTGPLHPFRQNADNFTFTS